MKTPDLALIFASTLHADAEWLCARVEEGSLTGAYVAENIRTRLDAAKAELEEWVAQLLPGVHYMDPPDGGSVTAWEQLERMAEDARRWREDPIKHCGNVKCLSCFSAKLTQCPHCGTQA